MENGRAKPSSTVKLHREAGAARGRVQSRLSRGRPAFVLLIDLALCGLCVPLSIMIRIGDIAIFEAPEYRFALSVGTPLIMAVCAIVFYLSGLYKSLWRFVSLHDVIAISKSALISVVLFAIIMFMLNRLENYPRSVPIIQFFLMVGLLSATRIVYRELVWVRRRRKDKASWRIPALLGIDL